MRKIATKIARVNGPLGWWLSGANYWELTRSFFIPQQAKTIESKESWVKTIRYLIAAAGNNILKLFASSVFSLYFAYARIKYIICNM